MKNFVAKHVEDLTPSGIRRFFDLVAEMEDIISLGVGEPDFKTPEHIRDAAINGLMNAPTKYSANLGLLELRENIVRYLKEQFSLAYDANTQVLCTIGASEAIDIALRTIITPGDEILVIEPGYVCYKPAILLQHGVPVVVTTDVKNRFRLTPEELKSAITEKTKAIIFPYPSNPTGAIMEREDLEALAPIFIEHDILVISDEIYAELTYGDKKHISIAEIEGMYERTLVLSGFSKAFAMTGWRLGYAVGPVDLIEAMNKIHAYMIMSAPIMSQWAGIEALRDEKLYEQDILIMRTAYDERRRYLLKEFERLGVDCFEAEGAFYLFPSIQKTGFTSEEFCEKLLFESKVAVVPGNAFGDCGEGFVRISYAYSIEELQMFIEKLEGFLEKFSK